MARKRMVTRTVKAVKVEALCLNTETAEPYNKEFVISGTPDDKFIEKFCRAEDTATEKFVAVVSKTEFEELYGMPEDEFLKYAVVLPPRTGNNAETEKDGE